METAQKCFFKSPDLGFYVVKRGLQKTYHNTQEINEDSFQAPTEKFELKSVNGLYILIMLYTRFIVNPWSAHLQSNASLR